MSRALVSSAMQLQRAAALLPVRPALLLSAAASAAPRAAAVAAARSLTTGRARAPQGPHHVPVGPGSNIDGVYRRPEVPEPTSALSEHDELMWDDAQAPEHILDQWEAWDKWEALRNLAGALTILFGGVYGAVWLYGAKRYSTPIEYPYDGLRLSRGGPNGAPNKQ